MRVERGHTRTGAVDVLLPASALADAYESDGWVAQCSHEGQQTHRWAGAVDVERGNLAEVDRAQVRADKLDSLSRQAVVAQKGARAQVVIGADAHGAVRGESCSGGRRAEAGHDVDDVAQLLEHALSEDAVRLLVAHRVDVAHAGREQRRVAHRVPVQQLEELPKAEPPEERLFRSIGEHVRKAAVSACQRCLALGGEEAAA